MAKQMKNYIAVTTASFMAMQLAACGNTETRTVEESPATTNNVTQENNTTSAGDDLQSVYDSDMANACDEWKENDDGSFECLDEHSPHYAHHFFNGLMYATTGAMLGSAIYKSRNLRNGTDRDDKNGGSAVPRTTHSNTTNSNGITTNDTQNPSGTTSSSSNNSTTNSSNTNNSNSNTDGTKSYSSGKRSYSNSSGSSTNSSSSYSNHSSSSTGKSGFGSGGASRGGSSSS
ncbi:hypothetical protein ACZ11_21965 [Lysinibacillus xylanilyticus]|uniref:Lipoprotein n=1 Tax=Lysinibacillus xylanilyticus TaxID=582475 RepID=A0A0K9F6B2_9BACI|nr:hypothetical protein [Lysinibacillus xylanilyticus]KMY29752.1 hypothetical protein ACZ11_21965 [Lysinibacillus xylanilyticus]